MSIHSFSVGVDIGGTNTKLGIIDEDGKILLQSKMKTQAVRGSQAVIQSIIDGIAAILRKASLQPRDIRGIGLGVPGTADSNKGVVVFAPNMFWRDVEIVRFIRNAFDIPVYIAQDTRAAAWAEYLIGVGQGLHSIASVTLGTGIGCGMVLDGKIVHGALNSAGEIGHLIVEVDGNLCNCGRRGCLEAYAGGLAIVRDAKEKLGKIFALSNKETSEIDVCDVFQLAQHGNAEARRLTDRAVKYIGIGLVNLVNVSSVELISISGGISNAAPELLLDPLREFIRDRAYEVVSHKVKICKSALGEDAPLIGAALLYRESRTEPEFLTVCL
jgi:glucokinase